MAMVVLMTTLSHIMVHIMRTEPNNKDVVRKRRNFVAKHARKFNKGAIHRDRTKYNRSKEWKYDGISEGG